MKLHPKEIEAVSKLEPFSRYQYFIKKIADAESMVTLVTNDGEYLLSIVEGKKLFPLWTLNEFAENCMIEGWSNSSVKVISLDTFQNELTDFISRNNYLLNIFPVGNTTGFVVNLDEFNKDLSEELTRYE